MTSGVRCEGEAAHRTSSRVQVCGASHGELLHILPIAFPLEMLTALYEKTRQLNALGLQSHDISELK